MKSQNRQREERIICSRPRKVSESSQGFHEWLVKPPSYHFQRKNLPKGKYARTRELPPAGEHSPQLRSSENEKV